MPSHSHKRSHGRRLPPELRNTDNSEDFSGSMSRKAWQQSIALAQHCKGVVYNGTQRETHPFNEIIPLHGEFLRSLTHTQNTKNGGDVVWHKQFTPKKFRHEIIRKFLHIHKPLLQKICRHYMTNCFQHKHKYGKLSRTLLREVLQSELTRNRSIENDGDRTILEMILAHDQLICAIHALLVHLRTDVCAIRWCSEWCNELDMWTDAHAPLLALITPNDNKKLPSYTTKQGYCFRPESYFGKDMGDAIQALHAEDLLQIIKIQWETDIMNRNLYLVSHVPIGRLVYEGNVVTHEFMLQRAWWIKMSKRENFKYQEEYKRKHPTLKYDRMPEAYGSSRIQAVV